MEKQGNGSIENSSKRSVKNNPISKLDFSVKITKAPSLVRANKTGITSPIRRSYSPVPVPRREMLSNSNNLGKGNFSERKTYDFPKDSSKSLKQFPFPPLISTPISNFSSSSSSSTSRTN